MKDSMEQAESTTGRLLEELLARIRGGAWPIGEAIPSERQLMTEFGVSRITVREVLSMLRSLGVLDTSQRRRSIVRKIGTDTLGRLFPLMLALDGEQTFQEVFEVRVAIEGPAAYLAAMRRDDDDVVRLEDLAVRFKDDLDSHVDADLQFHLGVAEATKNRMFVMLLTAISGYVRYPGLSPGADRHTDARRCPARRRAREPHRKTRRRDCRAGGGQSQCRTGFWRGTGAMDHRPRHAARRRGKKGEKMGCKSDQFDAMRAPTSPTAHIKRRLSASSWRASLAASC